MITVDEARELVNTAEIPFPQNWKEQILKTIDDSIRSIARSGKKISIINGKVYGNGVYSGSFNLSVEQFSEISAILKQNGFGVNEDFRIRFDGQPLTIDILW